VNQMRVVIGVVVGVAILSLVLLGRAQLGEPQAYAFVAGESAPGPDFAASQVTTPTAWIRLPLVRGGRTNLPDLLVDAVFNTWCPEEEGECACVPEPRPAKLMACIQNGGPVPAGAFDVTINDTMLRVASLSAGKRRCIEDGPEAFEADVHVDSNNEVHESREDNNTFSGPIPLPTPLPTCTP
jgi:hypothetical protein